MRGGKFLLDVKFWFWFIVYGWLKELQSWDGICVFSCPNHFISRSWTRSRTTTCPGFRDSVLIDRGDSRVLHAFRLGRGGDGFRTRGRSRVRRRRVRRALAEPPFGRSDRFEKNPRGASFFGCAEVGGPPRWLAMSSLELGPLPYIRRQTRPRRSFRKVWCILVSRSARTHRTAVSVCCLCVVCCRLWTPPLCGPQILTLAFAPHWLNSGCEQGDRQNSLWEWSEFSVPDAQADHNLLLFWLLLDPVCFWCGPHKQRRDISSDASHGQAPRFQPSKDPCPFLGIMSLWVWDLADFFV